MKPVSARFPVSADQPLEPDPCLDLGALLRRPLVVPQDRGTDDCAGRVERDEAVHLAGEADPGHLPPGRHLGERRL